jgi:hypothetical protein
MKATCSWRGDFGVAWFAGAQSSSPEKWKVGGMPANNGSLHEPL